MEVNYTGEHLFPGQLGHFLVILGFVSALLACIGYFFSAQASHEKQASAWRNFGRISFLTHAISVVGIVATLYLIISNHYFEYHYAWQHSSKALPWYYRFSCFWEGQEGSFLLWSAWHAVLGGFLIRTAKKWEAPVMAVVSLVQVFLGSMLFGIYFFGYKLGSSPFLLLRDVMTDAPIFQRADYLNFVLDGSGLNPLLQNYWMVIHPPVLFLGFASTLVPFAFAFAGLWKNDHDWIRPALPWTLFSGMILGTGILMGAAWAYEALSFGGFWAWDPVENASLVPWLTLIAGLHTLLIYKHSGHALRATYLFFVLTFILILYSTFLTRSGILGDTSVHSFTDLGMSGQLVVYMLAFLIPSFVLFLWRYVSIPSPKDEESFSSREFWMFIGALILLISAVQITFTTSIPVYNALWQGLGLDDWWGELNLAPPVDAIAHYNFIQIYIAIFLGVMSAGIQFFKYKKTSWKSWAKALTVPLLATIVVSCVIVYFMEMPIFPKVRLLVLGNELNFRIPSPYMLLVLASVFAVFANTHFIWQGLKWKLKAAGASISHVGFGLILLGILISNFNKEVISINREGIDFGSEFSDESKMENVLLRKNIPVEMAEYSVTYLGDTTIEPNTYYKVNYKKYKNPEGEIEDEFTLYPNAQINPDMGLVASPDTRHFLHKDIYTHVTSVPNRDEQHSDSGPEISMDTLSLGDTVITNRAFVVLTGFNPKSEIDGRVLKEGEIAVGAQLKAITIDSKVHDFEPIYLIEGNIASSIEDGDEAIGLFFTVERILPERNNFVIGIKETSEPVDFIILKALVFPYINILWLGCLFTFVGFIMSMARRLSENKRYDARAVT